VKGPLWLQVLGTVGEPINPEAWKWYHQVVGEGRCPIADTWWQTETGGHMITPLPGAWPQRPGSATRPFFGAAPVILHPESGKELEGVAEGVLCFKQVRWPQPRACFSACQRVAAIPIALQTGMGICIPIQIPPPPPFITRSGESGHQGSLRPSQGGMIAQGESTRSPHHGFFGSATLSSYNVFLLHVHGILLANRQTYCPR
jgi:hypothetical protein